MESKAIGMNDSKPSQTPSQMPQSVPASVNGDSNDSTGAVAVAKNQNNNVANNTPSNSAAVNSSALDDSSLSGKKRKIATEILGGAAPGKDVKEAAEKDVK